MARLASLALHMDSLRWAAGDSANVQSDPTWFEVLDRFLQAGAQRGLRFTIFAIGRDLECPRVRGRVRELREAGHEVANHSHGHRLDLGALGRDAIREEIKRAHDAIAAASGLAPRGFAAPNWSHSRTLLEVLREEGYLYDASLFPSWLMMPMLAKLLWNFRGHPRLWEMTRRADKASWFLGSKKLIGAHGGLVELPVPTTTLLRLPCWHTLAFVAPAPVFEAVLDDCLRAPQFMYVLHPADLMDLDDASAVPAAAAASFERLSYPLGRKRALLSRVLDRIVERSDRVVTCAEMAALSSGSSPRKTPSHATGDHDQAESAAGDQGR